VVIDVNNPEQKLKPGMTANLIITIDERNNVLKVPNSALRFTPQDASLRGTGARGNGQGRRDNASPNANAGGANTGQSGTGNTAGQGDGQRGNFAPASAPVLAGQTRVVWVMGQDGKPQSRRIKVGLTDGVSTEVLEGSLQEGEVVITGQTTSSAAKSPSTQNSAPGFGGAPRTGGGGGGRRN
jgi:HlyD family secretion protein